ncbi:unnamed protein product [Acanthoscelides obtectus]|uniref:Uncharacterized protein n=1 Tax=Acanthoscelides obtectus TaxID=200917 RepID=A0A9P0Q7S5_ACAOB|nr:unnamed protein product [Acanthoscelides obtectus]
MQLQYSPGRTATSTRNRANTLTRCGCSGAFCVCSISSTAACGTPTTELRLARCGSNRSRLEFCWMHGHQRRHRLHGNGLQPPLSSPAAADRRDTEPAPQTETLREDGGLPGSASYPPVWLDTSGDSVSGSSFVHRDSVRSPAEIETSCKYGEGVLKDHSAGGITREVLNILKNLDISIEKCYGQGYDGASVMSGAYNGVNAQGDASTACFDNFTLKRCRCPSTRYWNKEEKPITPKKVTTSRDVLRRVVDDSSTTTSGSSSGSSTVISWLYWNEKPFSCDLCTKANRTPTMSIVSGGFLLSHVPHWDWEIQFGGEGRALYFTPKLLSLCSTTSLDFPEVFLNRNVDLYYCRVNLCMIMYEEKQSLFCSRAGLQWI